jgi:hypothetical protein
MYGKHVSLALRTPSSTRLFTRRSAAVLVVVGVLCTPLFGPFRGHAVASASTPAPRVLLIGDSILDQQGSAAAFLLRQAGVNAKAMGVWESGLLTRDQYDHGKTKLSGFWFKKAKQAIRKFDPDVVGVYMNHNYWPPYPRDAKGHTIASLKSAAAQKMIGKQARALITILRARHAKVFFIAPIPAGTIKNADPRAWNPIWRGYAPVLRAMHVPVADSAHPLERPDGLRAETKPSCTGAPQRIRLPKHDVHLTRFGAGLAGTALAAYAANLVHADLPGSVAPGETTAALVPAPNGHGYWLVGCDGSVYHFGNARHFAGARAAVAGHHGVVAAVATPSGGGLWLVASDGTIASVGDAPNLAFANPPTVPITDAVGVSDEKGIWATTGTGAVLPAGTAVAHGGLVGVHLDAKIAGISPTHDGDGYWLVGAKGAVFPFGNAQSYGSIASSTKIKGAITGIAATADDHGYWLVGTDGGVFTFGNAHYDGNAIWTPLPGRGDIATPGPTSGIIATRGSAPGYRIFGTTGRVSAFGAAGWYGSDNNLAVGTQ